MSRALLVLHSQAIKAKAISWIEKAPFGTRLTFMGVKRTLPQNDKMWALLTEVSEQATHCGRRYSPDQWKVLMMHACGQEVQFIPSLDEKTFIPWGQRSSKLSKSEMSDLIEFIISWGLEHGVAFSDPTQVAA